MMLKKAIPFLILLFTVVWNYNSQMPSDVNTPPADDTEFSLENALRHLKVISEKPHYVGSEAHSAVRDYLFDELKNMGLKPHIQRQPISRSKRRVSATTIENVVAKIEGKGSGKALLIISHYDSDLAASYGAGDAGSGIVTILESVRAFLAKDQTPENDIIILLLDAEELGLLGAQAFVKHHQWAKDVGLVLNFEGRGSGGAGYMFIETNGKNKNLIKEYIKASPNYPATNSLLYSIYKTLPNDTDMTVFKEDGNNNGFNFAFMDDHFDYHTTQDNYERLDRETLLHQGDNLMTALHHFANADLTQLDSDEDHVFVNFPIVKIINYPFSWVLPMLIIAVLLFAALLATGIKKQVFSIKGVLQGFVPFLLALVVCTGVSYGLWKALVALYPAYKDMIQGFTYNGYQYILMFVFLNLFIALMIYNKFIARKKAVALLMAPIAVWIMMNLAIALLLKGAGFFIIPVYLALGGLAIQLFVNLNQDTKNTLFAILAVPTIYIFAPIVQMFPVGLGLQILFVDALLIVLILGLILPVFAQNNLRKVISGTSFVLILLFFVIAAFNSGFTKDNKKPNSLNYIYDTDAQKAFWVTYDHIIDDYTQQKVGTAPEPLPEELKTTYQLYYKNYKPAAVVPGILAAKESILNDTIINDDRHLTLKITPQRATNIIKLYTSDSIVLKTLSINGAIVNQKAKKDYVVKKARGLLFQYVMASDDDSLMVNFTIDKGITPHLFYKEISYDLAHYEALALKPRAEHMHPKPFIINDAVVTIKKLTF